jgi:E3 ubiquitin-protein ligase SIAH1
MDDMSRVLNEDLLKDLECTECMEYMVPPISLCTNGHNICSMCRWGVQRCPTCRADFSETRNVTLENIARRQRYPCVSRQNGCLELFSNEDIAEHQTVCVYGIIQCPFHLLNVCSWNGFKNDLKEHANAAHPDKLFERSTFTSSDLSEGLGIVSCFGELFTYYKRTRDGRLYCAVQLIGTSSEASKYKCEFTLRAANSIEQVSNTFLVHGYSEDFKSSFNSGKCLRLDEVTVRNFLVGNKLNLTIKLSTVQ